MKPFKIPQKEYLYLIQRELIEEIPFDKSIGAITINNAIYDIVPGRKNIGLERIADMIIDLDNKCFEKVHPGKELEYADKISEKLGIQINQMLFD